MGSLNAMQVLESISIPNSDTIRGNITLISHKDGMDISWKSSKPNVISDAPVGRKAAGVVNRKDIDEKVILTATIGCGDEAVSKQFEVNVVKAATRISEDDYVGYLFGHFIGEDTPDGEQIYFALSKDGLNFKDMNDCKPVLRSNIGEKGVRDPYIFRSPEGDRYFLIATDLSIYSRGGWITNAQGYFDASTTGSNNLVLWESNDLINWSEPKLLAIAPKNAGMAWAPEMVYCDETGEYIIFFASSIMNTETKYKAKPNAIYYVTTRDFVTFSDTKIFIDNQADNEPDGRGREIIDTTVLKIGDTYYSASKDGDNAEVNGGIRIMKTKDIFDPKSWEKVLDLDELGLDMSGHRINVLDNSMLEGPELFVYNKCDRANPDIPEYGLMTDQYALGAGYLPIKTTDIEDRTNEKGSWELLSKDKYSFDKLRKRHGTIFRLTKEEIIRLEGAFGGEK